MRRTTWLEIIFYFFVGNLGRLHFLGKVLIPQVHRDSCQEHVGIHKSTWRCNLSQFRICLFTALRVFPTKRCILWRLETFAARSVITLVKLVHSYLQLHEPLGLPVESIFFELAGVVVDNAWGIISWKSWHHNVKQELRWFATCHKWEPINNFLWTSTSHDHQAWGELVVWWENFFAQKC